MFFPKEHRKKMQESTFRPLLHRFCFLHLPIAQKERAYWLKRDKLQVQASHSAHPTDEKGKKALKTLVPSGRIQLPYILSMAEQ